MSPALSSRYLNKSEAGFQEEGQYILLPHFLTAYLFILVQLCFPFYSGLIGPAVALVWGFTRCLGSVQYMGVLHSAHSPCTIFPRLLSVMSRWNFESL